MLVSITRTTKDRMTDMYTIRFPGHPSRIMPFSRRHWDKVFNIRIKPGEKIQAELSLKQVDGE